MNYKKYVPEGITPIGFDIETFAFANRVAPELVCISFFDPRTDNGYVLDAYEGAKHLAQLLKDDSIWLIAHNANFDAIGCSLISPDLFVLFFKAYLDGRIHCTKMREALLLSGYHDNYGEIRSFTQGTKKIVSGLSLAGCLWKYHIIDITDTKSGADIWRLRYHELHAVPISQWPKEASDYAISDSKYALMVFMGQKVKADRVSPAILGVSGGTIIDDAPRQATAEFCLMYMASKTGIKIDQTKIEATRDGLMAEHDALVKRCKPWSFYSEVKSNRGVKKNTTRVIAVFDRCYKILQYEAPEIFTESTRASTNPTISTSSGARDNLLRMIAYAEENGKTPVSRIPLGQDLLDELGHLKDAIQSYAECESLWKEINTFVRGLRRSRLTRDSRVRFSYKGYVSTGRTSSSDPNMQNLPRGGDVRSCIVPEKGYVFVSADYSNAEMRSLAQENFWSQGRSSMLAAEYKKDPHFDPHIFAGYKMMNLEKHTTMSFIEAKAIYADKTHPMYKELKKYRTLAKILNFGLAGGLSHVSFVDYARGYKVYLTLSESKSLCEMWKQVWSEMTTYFNIRSTLMKTDPISGHKLTTPQQRTYVFRSTKRCRFLRKYTVSCNTPFQGISADGAKEAVIRVFKECYFMKKSPLYGSHPINFIHDEILLETPYDPANHADASKTALRLQKIMEVCMEKHTPDIPAIAEPSIAYQWTKNAESEVVDGVVQLWEPSAEDAEEEEVKPAKDPIEQARLKVAFNRAIKIINNLHQGAYTK